MDGQELCKKKLTDLSRRANLRGIVLFSDFLNLNELDIYHRNERLFACETRASGGVDFAERQMIAFIPDALSYEWRYPIRVLEAVPAYPKFAEQLGHRDILGAIMNMGVDRGKIGDIFVNNGRYFIVCTEEIAPYFIEHLDKIRHTAVKLSGVSADEVSAGDALTEKEGIVTSNRLDAFVACVYKLSRSGALSCLTEQKVFVNGKCTQNPSHRLAEGDIVSVRGFGRFLFEREYGETNKGRIKFRYRLYG